MLAHPEDMDLATMQSAETVCKLLPQWQTMAVCHDDDSEVTLTVTVLSNGCNERRQHTRHNFVSNTGPGLKCLRASIRTVSNDNVHG